MEENKKDKRKTLITALVIIAFLGAGFLISWRYTKSKLNLGSPLGGESALEVSPTLIPSLAPTVPALERKDLKVQVLNGIGVPGAAGEGKELLEALGYEEVATANADSYDYELTEIALKEGKEEYFELLKEDLEKNYEIATEASFLEEASEFDAQVTLGPAL
ncbi:LytR C-terminal domain-containing protein [Candidatus Shapirobacteria bacterium]|nr:LytR C-terminal domain-containing protein [Candidatus Shapirobacteria bacterium]